MKYDNQQPGSGYMFIDNGASKHVVAHKNLFHNFSKRDEVEAKHAKGSMMIF